MSFNGVDDFEAADGVGVRTCGFLSSERWRVVQEYGCIAALLHDDDDNHDDGDDDENVMITDVDETVVEEKTENGGANPCFSVDRLHHGVADNSLKVRATSGVEVV